MSRSLPQCTVLIALAALTIGCGPAKIGNDGVTVRGKVVKGGLPLEVPRRDIGLGSVAMTLIPEDTSLESHSYLVAEDGSFEFVGADHGIAPGKYKVAVLQQNEGPGSDLLKGKFSAEKTPITIDVPADKVGGELDLGTIELDDYK